MAASLTLSMCAFAISRSHSANQIFFLQLLCGMAMSFVSEGLPALSVVLTAPAGFGRRIARNELFAKIGAFVSLAVSGYLAQRFSLGAIFYVAIFSGLAVALSTGLLRLPVRERAPKAHFQLTRTNLKRLLDREFIFLLSLSFVYQFSNAPMFMIFEQNLARSGSVQAATIVSGVTMATQALFIVACLIFARLRFLRPSLKVLGIGFICIALRGLLLAFSLEAFAIAGSVLLDAIAAAVLILIPIQVIARKKTNNFNIASSAFGLVIVGGSSAGLSSAGQLLERFGAPTSFLALAGISLLGLLSLLGFIGFSRQQTPTTL